MNTLITDCDELSTTIECDTSPTSIDCDKSSPNIECETSYISAECDAPSANIECDASSTTIDIDRDNCPTRMSGPLDVAIETADHTKLAGVYYPNTSCSAAVLICASVGLGQKAYADFARWLNKAGFAVLTFDYRGKGDSLFGMSVKNSRAKKHEWGKLDMAAGLNWLYNKHSNIPLHIIAHDSAGILMGLMSNHAQISSVVCVGEPAIYVAQIAIVKRFIAGVFFRFFIPICLSCFGFLPLKFFGKEEDIPPGVAKQWADWSLHAGHIRNSFGTDIKKHFYRELQASVLVLSTSDDSSMGQSCREDILDLYRSARVEYQKVTTKSYGLGKVGHLNFFKVKYAKLWPIIRNWLKEPEKQTIRTATLKMHERVKTIRITRQLNRNAAYAGTRTRLNAPNTVFVGERRHVKI